MAENRTSTENEQLMAAIEMRIEAICGTSALVTGRCEPDAESLNETLTLQEELEALRAARRELQALRGERIAVLNNATNRTCGEDAELRALTIAYLTDLRDGGTQLTTKQESDLQVALGARIAFLRDKGEKRTSESCSQGENRTSEEETELQQAISLRIMELVAVETLGDSENEELVGLRAELRRMKEVNDELIEDYDEIRLCNFENSQLRNTTVTNTSSEVVQDSRASNWQPRRSRRTCKRRTVGSRTSSSRKRLPHVWLRRPR
jgi:hypothetical protein